MIQKIAVFIASIAASLVAGFIGSLATTPNIPTWYNALDKPLLNPPSWVFGPVWSILYVLMGIALALIILQRSKRAYHAYVWFGVQLALNTLWSVVFFGLQSPVGGIIVIGALIVSIIMTIRAFWAIDRTAAYLLIPYLLWVSFAAYLNVGIAVLNG